GGAGGAVDMGTEPVAPGCNILAPTGDARLTNRGTTTVQVRVTDPDTAPADLEVAIGRQGQLQIVSVDGAGEASLDLPVQEGANLFLLRATDETGLSCSASVTVVGDQTAPVITLIRPELNQVATDTAQYRVEGTIADEHPARTLTVTVGGQPVQAMPVWQDMGRSFQVEITLAEGENVVSLVTTDGAGNPSEAVGFTAILDQQAPELALTAPVAGLETAAETVALAGRVTLDGQPELDAVVDVRVADERGRQERVRNILPDEDGQFSAAVPLFVGTNTITACAEDAAGNRGCDERTVTRVEAVPCVAIEAPAADVVTGQPRIAVEGTVCPAVTAVLVRANDGQPVAAVVAGGRFTAEVGLPAVGQHTLLAVASAANGATAEARTTVIYDNTPPTVEITSPAQRNCVGSTQVEVRGRAFDNDSRVVALTVNGVAAEDFEGGAFAVRVDLEEGLDVPITAVATNAAGLRQQVQVLVDADGTPPVIQPDAQEGAFLGVSDVGRVELGGRIDVGFCGVNALFVEVDGDRRQAGLLGDGTYRHARPLADGPHLVRILATDRAGQSTTVVRNVVVDGTPPSITDFQPAPNTLLSVAVANVSAAVRDAGSGVDVATINGDDDVDRIGDRVRTQIAINEGETQVTFYARDRVGNETEIIISIYRDVTGPVVTIDFPPDNAPVAHPVYLTGTFDDGDEGSAGTREVRVNGERADLNPQTGRWSISGIELDPANPRVTVVAEDNEGNFSLDPATRSFQLPEYVGLDTGVFALGGAERTDLILGGDYNRDGRQDLVAFSSDAAGRSMIFLRQGDGTFRGTSALLAGLPEGPVTKAWPGDFDSDGDPDLLVWAANGLGLYLGNGAGSFNGPADDLPNLADLRDVVVSDIDRDGTLDVLLLAGVDTRFYYGRGNGSFFLDRLALLGLTGTEGLDRGVFADVNGDGLVDLIGTSAGAIRYWLGGTDPRFTQVQGLQGAEHGADTLMISDVDRDGALDVVALNGDARFYPIDGGAGLLPAEPLPWAAGDRALAIADLTNDARPDLVIVGDNGVRVLSDTGGGWQPVDLAALGVPPFGALTSVAVFDLDRDGDLDLLLGGPEGLSVVHSNKVLVDEDYHWALLDIRRTVEGEAGPLDAIGATVYVSLAGNLEPEWAIPANPHGPTVVPMGAANVDVDLEVRFLDRGARGAFFQPLAEVFHETIQTIFDVDR
ncbi:MAG: VCBS repeat-containing protein, partial [Myxococcales bacterium]|nr:VCBS repeat-containing protein [Myxococcales bacterium]